MFFDRINIAGTVNDSIVDGPGLRYTIFTQGCPHHCPGCHNPETHSLKGGKKVAIKKIIKEIKSNPLLMGVTFSGGEPFLQAKKLIPIAREVKQMGLHLACYSGYFFENLLSGQVPDAKNLLSYIDILIDGRFVLAKKSMNLKFKGSSNQRTIDVQKSLQEGKVILSDDKNWQD